MQKIKQNEQVRLWEYSCFRNSSQERFHPGHEHLTEIGKVRKGHQEISESRSL